MNRKTAKDYANELSKINDDTKRLNKQVKERLLTLATVYPNAVVGWVNDEFGGNTIKAKNTITKTHLERISIEDCIQYLTEMEQWIYRDSKHKQLEIDFN